MKDILMSPDSVSAQTGQARKILVWDAPVRLFHWLMALSFAGAYLTAESDNLHQLHVALGYTMGGLVIFRIVWGLIGTRYARFSEFVHGPKTVSHYVKMMLRKHPEHYVGHNPAGAIAIVSMLILALALSASGWMLNASIGGESLENIHEFLATAMLTVVSIHIAAVFFSSWLHHENLVSAMFSGRKKGLPNQGIRSPWRSVAVLMLVGVLGFWLLYWQYPAVGNQAYITATQNSDTHQEEDD